MAVDRNTMRDTLRFWGSGVTVVATLADEAHDFPYAGMTVSAFTSLSLEPPMVLVCLNKNTTTSECVLKRRFFSVSILSGDQASLSDRFAGRIDLPTHGDRFGGVPVHTAETGAPILNNALAWIDCRVQGVHDGSTHWIICGEVVAAGHKDDSASPLIYFNRGYVSLTPEGERS